MAPLYQSCVESFADLSTGIMVHKDISVINENFVYRKSQCTNQQDLINAAAENDGLLLDPHLNSHVSEAPPT